MNAIQFVAAARDDRHAARLLQALLLQDDCLGGRVLARTPSSGWGVQVFFRDVPAMTPAAMPDGMRRVLLTRGIAAQCGISWEGG